MISYSYRKTSVLTILVIISCSGQQENEIQGSDFPHLRMKRDVRQCKDKFKVLKTHSACQPRSSQVVEAGVNTSDIALILLEHNRYRGMVSPRATNMLKMNWDDEVAGIAQTWAETCSFEHDKNSDRQVPGRFSVGQNIGKGYSNWTHVIQAWYDEYRVYKYNDSKYNLHDVGHYTQLVWADTNMIGCGFANCNGVAFHVCDYAPGGNVNSLAQPYQTDNQSCQECTSHCSNNLCDCGANICENGASMDLTTCTCRCTRSFNIAANCKLDCRNLTEPVFCGKSPFDKGGCTILYNVPYDCPNMCNVCPYGGYMYKEGTYTSQNSGGSIRKFHLLHRILLILLFAIVWI